MEFKNWLKRTYKKDNGEPLSRKSVRIYLKAFKEVSKYIYRQDKLDLYALSSSDIKKILGRLEADPVFKDSENKAAKARAIELYIQFKDRK